MSLRTRHETVEHKILVKLAQLGMQLFEATSKTLIKNKLTKKDILQIRKLLKEIEAILP